MKTLTWAEIRRRYGIDVPALRELDPWVSCAIVRSSGIFWFLGRSAREASVEMFLIRLLQASDEPEFLYLEFDEARVPPDTAGGRLTHAANLIAGAHAGACSPTLRHFVIRPLSTGDESRNRI